MSSRSRKSRSRYLLWPCDPGLSLALVAGCAGVFAAEPPKPNGAELKYEEPKYLTGAIYASGSKQLLFKFKRTATRSGSTLTVLRDFTYPDGRLAARERVVYEGDALVSIELAESQIGASGSAKIRRAPDKPAKDSIDFEYAAQAGGKVKTRTEALTDNTLIGDMVGPFLTAHWDALLRGEKVKCRYVVLPRRETVGFTFVKESETKWQGQDVLMVKMEASSVIVEALIDPIVFTIEKGPPHHVLQYVGRTAPKIQAGGKWKDLDALTVFDWGSAR
jgi:hypothetical protein